MGKINLESTSRRYLALLRGINVGSANILAMSALRACFERLGHVEVSTYIQSGNVLFSSPKADGEELAAGIEAALQSGFGCTTRALVLSAAQLAQIVAQAPPGFGASPEQYRSDVIFLFKPLSAAEALSKVTPRPGVDTAMPGPAVLYFSRLIAEAGKSQLKKIISSPLYASMTIRNWNTTSRLHALLQPSSPGALPEQS